MAKCWVQDYVICLKWIQKACLDRRVRVMWPFVTWPESNEMTSFIQNYGVTGNVLKWINSFLTNSRHRVAINRSKSEWANVTSGIPQGSVLGPAFFVVFTNDMPEVTSDYLRMFADDTKIFSRVLTQRKNTIASKKTLSNSTIGLAAKI